MSVGSEIHFRGVDGDFTLDKAAKCIPPSGMHLQQGDTYGLGNNETREVRISRTSLFAMLEIKFRYTLGTLVPSEILRNQVVLTLSGNLTKNYGNDKSKGNFLDLQNTLRGEHHSDKRTVLHQ